MRLTTLPENRCWDPDTSADQWLLWVTSRVGSAIILLFSAFGVLFGSIRVSLFLKREVAKFRTRRHVARTARSPAPSIQLNLPATGEPSPVIVSENLYWGTPRSGAENTPVALKPSPGKPVPPPVLPESLLKPSGTLTLCADSPQPGRAKAKARSSSATGLSTRSRLRRRVSS